MIRAEEFIEPARSRGFEVYAGVPCSFLTPFIDRVIEDASLIYISSANEGDALATAAGATLAGRRAVAMMQNSGLGNALNPLTSLAWPFRLPILLVVTWRGDPELGDEPQHLLMGRITGALLDAMEIPWEIFPTEAEEVPGALDRAAAHHGKERRPYALLMRKGTVEARGPGDQPGAERGAAPFLSGREGSGAGDRTPAARPRDRTREPGSGRRRGGGISLPAERRPTRGEALRRVVELTSPEESVVIATTGHTGRELYAIADRANHLYMVGSMGCASSLGLGLAVARPDLRIVVVDGDGAALMRMGNLATVGAYAGAGFVHVLLDNEMHASTGGQATVSRGVSFADVAAACGYAETWQGDDLALLEEALAPADPGSGGPRFLHLKIRPGSPVGLPRPCLSPADAGERLASHLAALASRRPVAPAGSGGAAE
ncbi:MAG: phosphonopyruvate decarboxylase [Gemmatimonadota bacterium]